MMAWTNDSLLFGARLLTGRSSRCCCPGVWRTSYCASSTTSSRGSSSSTSAWSSREFAALEDTVYQTVANRVVDPIVQKPLAELRWLHKRMAVSKDQTTLQLLLRLPSLLHPRLPELRDAVQTAAATAVAGLQDDGGGGGGLRKTLQTAHVDVLATTPIPVMARLVHGHGHDDDDDGNDHDREEVMKALGPGLASVAHVVGVYSCKGGVGKSTVAVNLAYALARRGGRVGLLDLDVYGPSLPLLVSPADTAIRRSPLGTGMVYPIEHDNLKLMSLGFVNKHSGVPGSGPNNGAAIMKGLMTVKVVSQLLKGTDWGDLDVLVLDLPPGTGDVQLAVLQQLQLSGAVAVSTPSRLATADTIKGLEMFTSLGVPTMAVVENMAYFEDDTGRRHFPFGKGLDQSLSGSLPVVQLPISLAMNNGNETGEPIMMMKPSHEQRSCEHDAFQRLADHVCRDLLLTQYGHPDHEETLVRFEGETASFSLESITLKLHGGGNDSLTVRCVGNEGATQQSFKPARLRSRDPATGELIPNSPFLEEASTTTVQIDHSSSGRVPYKPSPSLKPLKVERRGRYGYAVEWADGATVIYSLQCIARAADGAIFTPKSIQNC